ncbi:MAG: ComEC/Rec2 family competence protein [Eggerthellales bacterium]|nr:ComEC/Rec2 family competence protein [Eggerthellales bacterium]
MGLCVLWALVAVPCVAVALYQFMRARELRSRRLSRTIVNATSRKLERVEASRARLASRRGAALVAAVLVWGVLCAGASFVDVPVDEGSAGQEAEATAGQSAETAGQEAAAEQSAAGQNATEQNDAEQEGSEQENAAGQGASTSEIEGQARVHFIDVGQGDCEFIQLSDGRTVLIDAGTASGGQAAVEYIRALGCTRIDVVIATHPDADHIGGMVAVFDAFDVGEVWMPNVEHDTQTFFNFLDAVEAEGCDAYAAWAGDVVVEGEGFVLEVISPVSDEYEDINDWSVVCRFVAGQRVFLFTGDASSQVVLDAHPGHADVLKVGHHGSSTSTSPGLVAEVSPAYAVISCEADNSYGHPHEETLAALEGVEVLRTDLLGTVVISTDGQEIMVE